MRVTSAVAVVFAIAALAVASAALISARGTDTVTPRLEAIGGRLDALETSLAANADNPRKLAARLDALEARTSALAAQVREASNAPQLDADALLRQLLSSQQLRDYVVRAGGRVPIATPAELPENVRLAVDATIKGLEVAGIRARSRNGRVCYEIEGLLNGEKYDLRIANNGEVLRAELPAERAPEEVRKAAETVAPGALFAVVEQELRKDGGVLFEFKDGRFENDGGKYDTKVIREGGQVRVWEAEMPPALLPAPVIKAARKAVPGIELTQGEFVNEDQVFFRVEGRVGGRKCEITVSQAGEVIRIKGKGLPRANQDAPGETLF